MSVSALGPRISVASSRRVELSVQSTLAMLQSLASQTFKGEHPIRRCAAFEGRLFALRRLITFLPVKRGKGAELHDLVAEAIRPFQPEDGNRFNVDGPKALGGSANGTSSQHGASMSLQPMPCQVRQPVRARGLGWITWT